VRAGSSTPDGIGGSSRERSSRGFDIYRNNVAIGLRDALADTFPVVAALVGDEFFSAMARVYVAANLPRSPVLHEYGASFPEFLEGFEPARRLPYLGDVARIEHARRRAYHAEDRPPLRIERLAEIAPPQMDRAVLELHPSLTVLRSEYPAHSIWAAHQGRDPKATLSDLPERGECVLVVRPELDVATARITPGLADILESIARGLPLAHVFASAEANGGDLSELGTMLAEAFTRGAVCGIRIESD
jgi:hypothetical protein